jgi:hypothetical protein
MEHFDACRHLLHSIDSRYTDEQWRVLFRSPWTGDAPGIALEKDGTIGGIMMLITAEREIEGQRVKVCAPSTWVVAPEFRPYSLSLVHEMMNSGQDLTIAQTPSEIAHKIFSRFGMSPLEETKILVLPGLRRKRFSTFESRLVSDHAPFPGCISAAASGYELILKRICKTKKGVRLPFFEVLYANQPLDGSILKRLAADLSWRFRTAGVFVDSRFTEGAVRGFRFPNRKLYHGSDIAPGKLDNLYSEIAVLHRGYP